MNNDDDLYMIFLLLLFPIQSFLVTVAMVRLLANIFQWPTLMEYQKGDDTLVIPVETYQAIDATITTMAILCYFAPTSLTWKSKL